MLSRRRIPAAAALMGLLSACAPTLGPPPPGPMAPPRNEAQFRAADFAWSQAPGRNALVGHLAYRMGETRYTCAGAVVIVTPETPWSRVRMQVLYKSDVRSALPAAEVRARNPQAPPGDSGPYIKRASCDAGDRFSVAGLPDGAWYVVTIAKPVPGASGPSIALMRRVVTRGGRATAFEL